ncbi:MAG TPA: BNR repeat-containing protein, partial [Proteiniphilum sp.]|nr:BNR repeat-containing protein [Proteiniphilum sp.]
MKGLLTLLALLLPLSVAYPQKLVDTGGNGYAGNSVNTAIFRINSLVTHHDNQYIAFYDGDGYLVLGKRRVDSENWTLCVTQQKGNVKDAHNVISIMVDGEGYLHVAFDHHDTPLRYFRGVRPGSLIMGEPEQMTGLDEDQVTYPGFYRLPDGDLLFTYRSGASGRGNLVMNRYDTASKKWERLHDILIDG